MDEPFVVAHRGYAGVAPENTIGAARRAADPRTAMLEVDVQPAACGTPVVIHDERLDGDRAGRPLTDASGLVRETELGTITDARVLGTAETVPTLEALLAAIPSTLAVTVELKRPGDGEASPGTSLEQAQRERRTAAWRPFVKRVGAVCSSVENPILYSSFCEGAIAAVSALEPAQPTAVIAGSDGAAALAVADRYDCAAIHPSVDAILGSTCEIDLLAAAHDAGRAVAAWTVETWLEAERLRDAGVDGLISDYPGLLDGPS